MSEAIQNDKQKLIDEIVKLRDEKKAVILAHLYQRPEIQQLADYVGDSLGLAQKAAATDAEVIVFCGVHFMAESASILCPDKIVLLPEPDAGCPMADMITADQLREMKARYPDALVVTYVNSSAAVKAESDIICTSANAVKIVQSLPPQKQIIFTPDKNLGAFVASRTGREMLLWPGYCPAHDQLQAEQIEKLRTEHPQADVLIHPEARPEVSQLADCVCSTSQMIGYVRQSEKEEFIIGTEEGILYRLTTEFPEKRFYLAAKTLYCRNMKLTSLEKLRDSLQRLQPRVSVDRAIRDKANLALARMLEVS